MAPRNELENVGLANAGQLTLGGCDGSGPTHVIDEQTGARSGYEPSVAEAVAEQLGLTVRWETLAWADLYPALQDGRVDGIIYNQGITAERLTKADFTSPYGLFHESILVLAGSDINAPADLRGRRLAALTNTTNMKLAQAIDGADIVDFEASVEGFYAMMDALRNGDVDALVDDELFLEPYEAEGFRIAFTIKTSNAYGIAVRKGTPLLPLLDDALGAVLESGRLAEIWSASFPGHEFERPDPQPERSVADLRAIVQA